MNGQISAALVVMGAMVLFAGSAADRAGAQSFWHGVRQIERGRCDRTMGSKLVRRKIRTKPGATMPGVTTRRRPDDDRAPRDDRRSDVPAEGERVTLPPDTIISVRIADEINSSKNHTGDIFTGIVDPSVLVHDQVVIPRGTEAHVRMAEDKKGGHIHGKAEVRLELVSLVVNGRRLGVESDQEVRGQGAAAAKG